MIAGLAVFCQALALAGCLYLAAAALLVRRYAAQSQPTLAGSPPSVTLLKPLHGDEPRLLDNLESFCRQDYPGPVQVVFGVADPGDRAVVTVRALQAAHPQLAIDLVCDPRRAGQNAKISNLINMVNAARHDVLVLADSDILVRPDHLSRVVATLDQAGVAGVTCLYHGVATPGLWSRLNAMAVDTHFLPSVVVGVSAGLAQPCFGSTIAFRRDLLPQIRGFRTLANDLADDYALGEALRRDGGTVAIPPFSVGHTCTERSFGSLWNHEVRWTRTVRSVDPAGYAGSLLTHPFPFAVLGLCLGGGWPAATLAILALGLRFLLCLAVAGSFRVQIQPVWLIPVRDLLSFTVFVRACFGGAVRWRDEIHVVRPDGTMTGREDRVGS